MEDCSQSHSKFCMEWTLTIWGIVWFLGMLAARLQGWKCRSVCWSVHWNISTTIINCIKFDDLLNFHVAPSSGKYLEPQTVFVFSSLCLLLLTLTWWLVHSLHVCKVEHSFKLLFFYTPTCSHWSTTSVTHENHLQTNKTYLSYYNINHHGKQQASSHSP